MTLPLKSQQVVAKLAEVLADVGGAKVERNAPLPATAPSNGLVIIHDGDPGDPVDVLLGSVEYSWEHEVPIEVVVQKATTAARIDQLSTLLAAVGERLRADRTLGGLVDYIEFGPPDFQDEAIKGAAALKGAAVMLRISYDSPDSLS